MTDFLISLTVVLLFGFVLGIWGTPLTPDVGFGMYSLNLNALFNAESKYHTNWSSFLSNRLLYSSQGDGIYYLGLPMSSGLVVSDLYLYR